MNLHPKILIVLLRILNTWLLPTSNAAKRKKWRTSWPCLRSGTKKWRRRSSNSTRCLFYRNLTTEAFAKH